MPFELMYPEGESTKKSGADKLTHAPSTVSNAIARGPGTASPETITTMLILSSYAGCWKCATTPVPEKRIAVTVAREVPTTEVSTVDPGVPPLIVKPTIRGDDDGMFAPYGPLAPIVFKVAARLPDLRDIPFWCSQKERCSVLAQSGSENSAARCLLSEKKQTQVGCRLLSGARMLMRIPIISLLFLFVSFDRRLSWL